MVESTVSVKVLSSSDESKDCVCDTETAFLLYSMGFVKLINLDFMISNLVQRIPSPCTYSLTQDKTAAFWRLVGAKTFPKWNWINEILTAAHALAFKHHIYINLPRASTQTYLNAGMRGLQGACQSVSINIECTAWTWSDASRSGCAIKISKYACYGVLWMTISATVLRQAYFQVMWPRPYMYWRKKGCRLRSCLLNYGRTCALLKDIPGKRVLVNWRRETVANKVRYRVSRNHRLEYCIWNIWVIKRNWRSLFVVGESYSTFEQPV